VIEGMAETIRALDAMGVGFEDEIKPILNPEADYIVGVMQGNLAHEKTGRLMRSIKNINPDKFKNVVLVGPDRTPDGQGTMTIGALAAIMEYGSAPRVSKSGMPLRFKDESGNWVSKYQVAPVIGNGFVRNTFDMTKEKVNEAVMKGLQIVIEKKAKENNLTTK